MLFSTHSAGFLNYSRAFIRILGANLFYGEYIFCISGMTASAAEAAFQLCPDMHTQYFPVLQLGGWGNGSKVSCPRKQQ